MESKGFDLIENSNYLLLAAGVIIALVLNQLIVGSVFLSAGVAYSFIT